MGMVTDMVMATGMVINMGNINNRDETKFGKIYPVYKQDLF